MSERAREREQRDVQELDAYVCVHACERERARDRARAKERETHTHIQGNRGGEEGGGRRNRREERGRDTW